MVLTKIFKKFHNGIDMKLGSVTKFDKRNTTTSKNLTMTSCRQMKTS